MTERMTPTSSSAAGMRINWVGKFLIVLLALFLAGCDTLLPTPTPAVQPEAGGVNAPSVQNTGANADASAGTALPETSAPPATPTREPLTGRVTLWHSWAGRDGDALSAVLADLRERAPGLAIDTLFVAPNELPQAYADAVRNGGGPDLVATESWWLDELVAAGVVLPIEGDLSLRSPEDYFPTALQALQRKGTIFGLPVNLATVALYWNKNLAQQPPATTSEMLAFAQSSGSLGTGLYASLYHLWWGFPAYSAQLFDDDGRVVLDQNSGAAEFLAWLKSLNETPGSFVDDDYGMLLDRFKKGEFAFFVDGPWAATDLRSALGAALAVSPLPSGPMGPARPWLNAEGLFVNPNLGAAQRRLALCTAEELTGPEAASLFAQVGGWLPANYKAVAPDDSLIIGFMQQAATAQPAPTNPEMEQVWGYGGDMLIKVLTGVAEPGAAVSEASALINEANGK